MCLISDCQWVIGPAVSILSEAQVDVSDVKINLGIKADFRARGLFE